MKKFGPQKVLGFHVPLGSSKNVVHVIDMKSKPFLAFTAIVVFGYLIQTACTAYVRTIASLVLINAILCHIFGFVEWDVMCNAALTSFVYMSITNSNEMFFLFLTWACVWLINHHFIQSALLHTIGVQGVGALFLSLCKFD